MTLPHILIPVKSLSDGKSRLASVLDPAQRRTLNVDLVTRTLALSAEYVGNTQCRVISPCLDTLALARGCGIRGMAQRDAQGLNAAVQTGVDRLRYEGADGILVVACDLPLLRVRDLRAVVNLGATKGAVVVATDRHGQGTNLLYIPKGVRLHFSYGEGSLARHYLESLRAGRECVVYRSDTAGFDIDIPRDLESWRAIEREPLP